MVARRHAGLVRSAVPTPPPASPSKRRLPPHIGTIRERPHPVPSGDGARVSGRCMKTCAASRGANRRPMRPPLRQCPVVAAPAAKLPAQGRQRLPLGWRERWAAVEAGDVDKRRRRGHAWPAGSAPASMATRQSWICAMPRASLPASRGRKGGCTAVVVAGSRCPAKVAMACSSHPARARSVRQRWRSVCVLKRGTPAASAIGARPWTRSRASAAARDCAETPIGTAGRAPG